MKKALVFMVLILLVSVSQSGTAVSAVDHKALMMSSVNKLVPLGYYGGLMKSSLRNAGYSVTTLNDSRITLDFITRNLNNYDLIIWRTNSFIWNHETYWYVGEGTNQQTQSKYSADFNAGRANAQAGIIGVSASFFSYHYSPQSLKNLKLAILISSNSVTIATVLQSAGVQSVIYCMGTITLGFGIIDTYTAQLVAYLAMGQSVFTVVSNIHSPFTGTPQPQYLDTNYEPPFWYIGQPNLTIP